MGRADPELGAGGGRPVHRGGVLRAARRGAARPPRARGALPRRGPFTANHWEARYLAPVTPIARGWERQLDIARNGLFYDGALGPARYRRWLDEQGVRYVALSDAPTDDAGTAEAALVRAGSAGLRAVWAGGHWRLFAVPGARGLARGAARVTAIGPDGVELRATRAGAVDLRVRFTPYWRIATGRGCVAEGRGGWTRLALRAPGPVVLRASFRPARIRATSAECTHG